MDTTGSTTSPVERGSATPAAGRRVDAARSSVEGTRATTLCGRRARGRRIVSHIPNVLDGVRPRWIYPQFGRRTGGLRDRIQELAERVRGSPRRGSDQRNPPEWSSAQGLRFSEIGCRPPGSGRGPGTRRGNDVASTARGRTPGHGQSAPPLAAWHRDRRAPATRPRRPRQRLPARREAQPARRVGDRAHLPPRARPRSPSRQDGQRLRRMRHTDTKCCAECDDSGRTVPARGMRAGSSARSATHSGCKVAGRWVAGRSRR